jgi:hypothetical protein
MGRKVIVLIALSLLLALSTTACKREAAAPAPATPAPAASPAPVEQLLAHPHEASEGAGCEYREIPGTATVVSAEWPIVFDFAPGDPKVVLQIPSWSNRRVEFEMTADEAPCVRAQGFTRGSAHPATRSEILKGSCAPVVFRIHDFDLARCRKISKP